MSGHSKWSTIKRKKGAADAKRGQLFTRLAREIVIAVREGGGDPEANFRLRLTIDKARTNNMPKENIDRAIKRGLGGDKDGNSLEHVIYEGYGPHGVAIMVECVTDNRNRVVAEIRHILTRHGGSLGEGGSVAWQFKRSAYFSFPAKGQDPDKIFELAVDAGADDVIFDEEDIEIYAPVEAFKQISDRLHAVKIAVEEAGIRMIPTNEMDLSKEDSLQVMRVIDGLEEIDDVQDVYSNLNLSDEVLAQLETA